MEVVAQVVGTLSDMAVDDGETVVEGQLLCQIECMKTYFPLYAPRAGVVHFERELGEVIGEGETVAVVGDD